MDQLFARLSQFWEIVLNAWEHGFMGVDVGRVLLSILIFVVFLGLRQLFSRIVIAALQRFAEKSHWTFDDQIVQALQSPLRFLPVSLGIFFALEEMQLNGKLDMFAGKIILSLVTFNLFWALVNLVEPMSFLLKKLEKIFTPVMLQWLIKGIRTALTLIGCAAVLETWGIRVGPFIAGMGLFGVAVALGAQDMFKNLIAGLLVIAEKRFHPGDWIKVDGIVEGTVEEIGFRSTMIRRFDKAPVYVPNSQLADNAVTNFSAMTHRRIYWKIGVLYNTSISQLRRIRDSIESYIFSNDDFAGAGEVSTFVRIDSFNDSSIDIMLYCFTKTTNWGEWLKVKEDLAYKVKEIVEAAGSGFAFPSRTVYLETACDVLDKLDKPETFVPPDARELASSSASLRT